MKAFFKKRERGAVLLVILAVASMILPLVQAVWLDSKIEREFNRYRMNELQARYNAQSGLGLSLLRIYIFKGIEKTISGSWDSVARPLLDRIWLFPFVWPMAPPEEWLEGDKQNLQGYADRSFLKGAYGLSIAPEDRLLDLNSLSSAFEPLRNFTYEALFQLLLSAQERSPELKDKYQPKDFARILNNLSDWTDEDSQSQNGGSEELVEEGQLPLNRSFISVEEIKKVPGLSREIYDILEPHVTVHGAGALNINYASKDILRALNIPENFVESILSRTQITSEYYDPYLSQKAFCDEMDKLGSAFCETVKNSYETLDLLNFGYPVAFRIKSSGEYKGRLAELEALLYDLSSSALNYQKFFYREQNRRKLKEEGREARPHQQLLEKDKSQKKKQIKIDYSYYKSLVILYLKESF